MTRSASTMRLAKPHLDVGLFARQIDAQLPFWAGEVGLAPDHLLKLGGGLRQHRFHVRGSVLKLNHSREPLPESPPSGITGLRIASDTLASPRDLHDPDGNRVTLVPRGLHGVTGIGIDLAVSDLGAHEPFWRHVMQCTQAAADTYRCGDTVLFLREDRSVQRAGTWRAYGWRYLTVQVVDCRAAHQGVLDRGGLEAEPPRQLGDVAIISFVRDPDGNFIELSQRASLVGSL